MLRSRCLSATAVVAAALMLAPRAVRAQTWIHSWTLCTAGISSCHSVSLQTDAVFDNTNTRVGTTISITLHNLQGQTGSDLTNASGLVSVDFLRPTEALGAHGSTAVGGVASGGATGIPGYPGSPTWFWSTGVDNGGSGALNVGASEPLGPTNGVIGGCSQGTLNNQSFPWYGGFTCGTNAAFTFSFTLGEIVDANQFTSLLLYAAGSNDIGGTLDGCYTNPSPYANPYPCHTVSESDIQTDVTPEPMTAVLLGTGLFGIGATYRRRRKRPLPEV